MWAEHKLPWTVKYAIARHEMNLPNASWLQMCVQMVLNSGCGYK